MVKVERQIRRIFTHLIYQHPNFKRSDVAKLRRILAENRNMYFENFLKGVDEIYPEWGEALSAAFNSEIGYDEFGRNSYRKSKRQLALKNEDDFSSLKKYKKLLKNR